MGNSWWDPRGWFSRPATFASPQNTQYYSMKMALDSGLIDGEGATREQALSVPAVLKGRNMICGISTIPLQILDPARKPVREPLFEQIDPQVPNVVTLAQTVEDLIFDGIGWWEVTARGWNSYPSSARHVDSRRVTINPPPQYVNALPSGFDPRSTIYVDGKPRNALDFIRFDSPNPPLLVAAARAINRAVLLEDAAAMYADNPRPGDYFTPKNEAAALDEAKVMDTLRAWVAARKKRSTAFVPETLEYNSVQAPNPQELQLVQLQNRAALDIANAIGVDPEDLGISTTSRTYQNATDRRQDRVNDVLSAYMRSITDRLTMPDITRRGYRAYFDLDEYMRADPATRWQTAKIAAELGATDVAEIRERETWPERPDLKKPEPPPAPVAAVTEVPAAVENSRGESMHRTFSGSSKPVNLRLDADSTEFRVDTQRRVIKGRIALYGVPANNGEGTFTFAPGSIQWKRSAVNRVKFLRDHDWGASVGAALAIRETPDGGGLDGEFKVARGPLGDQALNDAEDGAADGLSVGVDIQEWEETAPGEFFVTKAFLNETSLTPRPAFDDARLTSVAASNTKGKTMPEKTPDAPADLDERITAAVAAAFAKANEKPETKHDDTKSAELSKADGEKPDVVNPAARPTPGEKFARASIKDEASPYTFDRAGRFTAGEHEFSTDFGRMLRDQDFDGTRTEAGKRVMGHISKHFAVATGDVDELNPAINRPDMYYNPPGDRTPLWNMINKGGLPNGLQPFTLPKFNSASGLTGDHTPGTEPSSGSFTTTSQTITPSGISGKVSVQREVIDMGGNPATSNLIWNRMVRSYQEGLESASATFLATLTAATDIALGVAPTDAELAAALKAMVVSLNFLPGYDWDAFAMEEQLYTDASNATASDGRPYFPQIGGTNVDGGATNLWQSLNIGGLRGTPAAALTATAGALNSSWLFDRSVVHGYATAPRRLEFAGTDASGDYAPVAMVDIAIWGYKAFANIDIAGVRQVTYDNAA